MSLDWCAVIMSVFFPCARLCGWCLLPDPAGPRGLGAASLAKYETQTDDSGQAKSEKYSSTDSAPQSSILRYNQL